MIHQEPTDSDSGRTAIAVVDVVVVDIQLMQAHLLTTFGDCYRHLRIYTHIYAAIHIHTSIKSSFKFSLTGHILII